MNGHLAAVACVATRACRAGAAEVLVARLRKSRNEELRGVKARTPTSRSRDAVTMTCKGREACCAMGVAASPALPRRPHAGVRTTRQGCAGKAASSAPPAPLVSLADPYWQCTRRLCGDSQPARRTTDRCCSPSGALAMQAAQTQPSSVSCACSQGRARCASAAPRARGGGATIGPARRVLPL